MTFDLFLSESAGSRSLHRLVEATEDPDFFGFHSPDLEGFTGVGHSIEDCLYKARWGMQDHVNTMRENGLRVPDPNPNPTVVIQNERKLEPALS